VSFANVPEAAAADVDALGRFAFLGVTPGSYMMRVTFNPVQRIEMPFDPGTGGTSMLKPGSEPAVQRRATQWAAAPIMVGDKDVTGVTLALRDAAHVSGQIVFDGAAARPASRDLLSSAVRVSDVSPMNGVMAPTLQGRFSEDGRFSVEGVVP